MKIVVADASNGPEKVAILLTNEEAAALKVYLSGEHQPFELALDGCQLAIRLSKELP